MVCIHGFTDSWRTWELVLPILERHHDVLAVTLQGHAGAPPLGGAMSEYLLAEGVERAMEEAGFDRAHLVGNSLGGYVALQLATRGRAETVVALNPAGGWPKGDPIAKETAAHFKTMHGLVKAAAPYADQIVSTIEGRRRATQFTTENFEHIPAELLAHQIRAVAACDAEVMIQYALEAGYSLDAQRIDCPVRILWGTEDKVLGPPAATRFREEWVPQAEWIELEGIGHSPQLDVPAETADLILGFTTRVAPSHAQATTPP